MSKAKSRRGSSFSIALRKLIVSGFVVFSFVAYAVHERLVNPDAVDNIPAPNNSTAQTQLQLTSQQASAPQQVVSNPVQQQPASNSAQQQPASNPAQQQPNLVEQHPAVIPTNVPPPTNPPPPTATTKPVGMYRDGEYTGPVVDAYYGLVQVKAVVQGGRITDVQFLQYPNDRRTSQRINSIAMPYLQQEAVQAQSSYVNLISGATLTSEGFVQSLQAALQSAKNSLTS